MASYKKNTALKYQDDDNNDRKRNQVSINAGDRNENENLLFAEFVVLDMLPRNQGQRRSRRYCSGLPTGHRSRLRLLPAAVEPGPPESQKDHFFTSQIHIVKIHP